MNWREVHPTLSRIIEDMSRELEQLRTRVAELEKPKPRGRPRKVRDANL